jgi:TPR repeat protein
MKRLIALVFLLSVSAGAAGAQDLEKGRKAFEKGDYEAALAELLPLAERGNAEAQYDVGLMYSKGLGVPQNDVTAAKWIKAAAEQGNAEAQLEFVLLLNIGMGVPQNYTVGANWLKAAAEQGFGDAQYWLGNAYRRGRGVLQDPVMAYMWFNLSSNAQKWPARASDENIKDQIEVSRAYRDLVANEMTRAEIKEAQRRTREWLDAHPQ